ncbi:MAG: hypothetical protein Tsb008_16250 [Rhodothalassiaceae bacterium]
MKTVTALAASLSLALYAVLATASAQTDEDAEKEAAVAALVNATEAGAMADELVGLFIEDILPELLEANPGKEEALRAMLDSGVRAAMEEMKPDVIALTTSVWSRHFTLEEIRGLTDFYRTPLGRKLLEKQPIIARESMEGGMFISQRAARLAMQRVKAAMTEAGLTVPPQF